MNIYSDKTRSHNKLPDPLAVNVSSNNKIIAKKKRLTKTQIGIWKGFATLKINLRF